ncbi:MAG: hypothetical protein K5888_09775 [Lachnospiraceae bacterium]|nr:hypothetical protein [Lachnospiraceae bacterium]
MGSKSKLDIFLNYEIRIKSIVFKMVDLIFMLCLMVLAFFVRLKLFPIESADYYGFLKIWMDQIKSLGGFPSLGTEISNYSSSYMYLMCLVSGIDNTLYALKSISVFFDYVAAFAVFAIVYELTGSVRKGIFGMSALLLCPLVVLDSAYWCQCDIIYTSFILWALYFFYKENSTWTFIFLAFAFTFKLQTVFILPFIVIMYLKHKTVKLKDILYIPIIFFVFQIPAWLFGRPLKDLLLIYFNQSDFYPWGTLEYPNIYALLDETIDSNHHMNEVTGAGMFLTLILLGFVAYYIYVRNVELTNDLTITLALFTLCITLYTLPHMHDRYGFLIDLTAIIYCMLRPKRIPVTVGLMFVSICISTPYLISFRVMDLKYVSIIQLSLITFIGYDLYKLVCENIKEDSPEEELSDVITYEEDEDLFAGSESEEDDLFVESDFTDDLSEESGIEEYDLSGSDQYTTDTDETEDFEDLVLNIDEEEPSSY